MFGAMPPGERWTAFERFYRLPDADDRTLLCVAQHAVGSRAHPARAPAGRRVSWRRLVGSQRGGMNGRARPRPAERRAALAALVDDALAPARLEAWRTPRTGRGARRDGRLPAGRDWDRAVSATSRATSWRGRAGSSGRGSRAGLSPRGRAGEPPPLRWPALVEIIHAGSLIVDDIEDGSTQRRGAPCRPPAYGVPLALNGANWMYFWRAGDGRRRLEPATPPVRDRISARRGRRAWRAATSGRRSICRSTSGACRARRSTAPSRPARC